MFILVKDQLKLGAEAVGSKWDEYSRYLDENKKALPVSAYEFAIAKWHYDFNDHRCPHDAWVQSFRVYEEFSGSRSEIRRTQIAVELLGAYHDGVIKIDYVDVLSYEVSLRSGCHGDWLYDEVRVSAENKVVHEIDFEFSHWIIECSDIRCEWLPNDLYPAG